jgi:16S rRNA (cytidine1402-2'-O)-methyltransferase
MAVAALSADRFVFYGFLPQKKGKKKKILRELLECPFPIVLYESPRRIKETLELIVETGGQRYIVLARELTKVYEEVWRGWAHEALDRFETGEGKGEFTVIVDAPSRESRK